MKNWSEFIAYESEQAYLKETFSYVQNKRDEGVVIFPAAEDVFNAFSSTPLSDVKVVILGQDPYHGPNQAHGLCFSVLPEMKIPPSLVNMYKELTDDIEGFEMPQHGYLQSWAEQGVLLLNTVLTVEQGVAHSHKHLGWEQFTDKAIELLNEQATSIIFILWGAHAKKKGKNINTNKHTVLSGPHPSPLSAYRGFFGCKHFSKTNAILTQQGKQAINWQPIL